MKLSRRTFMAGIAALSGAPSATAAGRIFDGHCHIIDHRFPIIENQGYTPPHFPLDAYLAQVTPLGVIGGAVVSGSFQGFDQSYLKATLPKLGANWVGVTQVPNDIADRDIAELAAIGVRALRFNILRGSIDNVDDIIALATRAHAVGKWHAEIYADAAALRPHVDRLAKLPQIAVDHLGMTADGLPVVLDLVAAGAKVKATGFGRVTLDVPLALEKIAAASPTALVFGTDLPSTRAQRPFAPTDFDLVKRVLGPELANLALWDNAAALYRLN
jgi:predicted TIM-barrel fold metal-dependent hydrolase